MINFICFYLSNKACINTAVGGAPGWAAPILAIPAQLTALEQKVNGISSQLARIANSSATAQHHRLQVVPVFGLMPIIWYPDTLADLGAGLSHARADALLGFYGLQSDQGNDDAGLALKSDAIRAEIGVR